MAISISWLRKRSIGPAPEVRRMVISGLFLINSGTTKFDKKTNLPIHNVLKTLLLSREDNPEEWRNSYAIYNRSEDNSNLSPETIYRIFTHMEFEHDTNANSKVNPNWILNLDNINVDIVGNLTDEEYDVMKNKWCNCEGFNCEIWS